MYKREKDERDERMTPTSEGTETIEGEAVQQVEKRVADGG